MKRSHIRSLARVALGTALLCLSAFLTVPFPPIPFTVQSYALLAVCGLLGAKRGLAATLLYLALGAVGLPVFSGFGGGLGALLGPTGGFLLGFLFVPLLCFFTEKRGMGALALGFALALLLSYAAGSLWYCFLFAEGEGFLSTLTVTVLPFLLPDAVKLALALFTVKRLKRFVI